MKKTNIRKIKNQKEKMKKKKHVESPEPKKEYEKKIRGKS